MKIKKRDSSAVIDSLSSGVVPRRGIHHIMVGRAEEANQILSDLENVKEGASIVKFFIGDFGSGKSFIQGLIQQVGFQQKFVVTSADFSPEKRLYGRNGMALNLYSELMSNLATSTSPEGNALSVILEKWINTIQMEVVQERGYDGIDFSNRAFVREVEEKITKLVSEMDELTGGFDFAKIISVYYKGYVEDNQEDRRNALRWLRGEYPNKTEAKKDLPVSDIIDDSNYYSYLKVLSQFVKEIGYSGLILNFDEAINLYKINHAQAREKNYETILNMFNDALQGSLEGLYITFSGTKEFLTDERKGLYSYGALKRRLEVNKYETEQFRDLSQPVIQLSPLKHEEILVLLQKINEIHAHHFNYVSDVTEEDLKGFIIKEFSVPGAEKFTTVGHIVKRFIDGLNIMNQNPDFDRNEIFGQNVDSKDNKSTSNTREQVEETKHEPADLEENQETTSSNDDIMNRFSQS
ncbi:ATP-binding protein [Salibacterium qingdaonense]|uniref:Biotin carboxylase n=1 Tax=Salibacterium qingdaonense TaxID=266892 RepID=A0A1I4QA01_9BACI|nr:ATP-binding protein [Salibacterium qingdaonense]SFM36626.1 P-loop protein of unknown function [Salibacterium qingdaonense]